MGLGNLKWVEELCDETTLAFDNSGVRVIANFGGSVNLPSGELLATTQHDLTVEGVLEHDQVAWIRL
jgi:hypothetical protein